MARLESLILGQIRLNCASHVAAACWARAQGRSAPAAAAQVPARQQHDMRALLSADFASQVLHDRSRRGVLLVSFTLD